MSLIRDGHRSSASCDADAKASSKHASATVPINKDRYPVHHVVMYKRLFHAGPARVSQTCQQDGIRIIKETIVDEAKRIQGDARICVSR